jgi:hypothetical protein
MTKKQHLATRPFQKKLLAQKNFINLQNHSQTIVDVKKQLFGKKKNYFFFLAHVVVIFLIMSWMPLQGIYKGL